MKPLHIVVLLAAGALGGAVIMKVGDEAAVSSARTGSGDGCMNP